MKLQYYAVTWIEYDLPGGKLAKILTPDSIEKLAGTAKPCQKMFSKKAEAVNQVRDLEEFNAPRFYWCEGLRWHEKDVKFVTTVEIKGIDS